MYSMGSDNNISKQIFDESDKASFDKKKNEINLKAVEAKTPTVTSDHEDIWDDEFFY